MQWLLIETAWRKSCSRLSAYPQLTLLSKHCGLYACWDGRWPSSWNCNGVSHAESTCEGCVLPFWRVKLVGRDFTKCIFINREHAAHVRDFLLAVFVRWLSRSIFSVLAGADNEHRHDFDSVCVSSWLVGTSRSTCEALKACGYSIAATAAVILKGFNCRLSPTYAGVVFHVGNDRWRGVSFLFLVGKRLDEPLAEVRVACKMCSNNRFVAGPSADCGSTLARRFT